MSDWEILEDIAKVQAQLAEYQKTVIFDQTSIREPQAKSMRKRALNLFLMRVDLLKQKAASDIKEAEE